MQIRGVEYVECQCMASANRRCLLQWACCRAARRADAAARAKPRCGILGARGHGASIIDRSAAGSGHRFSRSSTHRRQCWRRLLLRPVYISCRSVQRRDRECTDGRRRFCRRFGPSARAYRRFRASRHFCIGSLFGVACLCRPPGILRYRIEEIGKPHQSQCAFVCLPSLFVDGERIGGKQTSREAKCSE